MPTENPAYKLNFLQHIFGTSLLSIIINSFLVAVWLYCLIRFVVLPIFMLFIRTLDLWRLPRRAIVFIELTPPAFSTKTQNATSQFFSIIHGLTSYGSRKEELLMRKKLLSLEIVSTRELGIRYIVGLTEGDQDTFEQQITSYLPGIRIRRVDDYMEDLPSMDNISIEEFKLSNHFAYPLAQQNVLSEHDPIAYLTGSMAKPDVGDLIAFQLVLSSDSQHTTDKIRNQLLNGRDVDLRRHFWQYPFQLLRKIIGVLLSLIGKETFNNQKMKLPTVTPGSRSVIDSVQAKLSQPLFSVEMRVLVASKSEQQRRQRLKSFANSLHLFHVPGFQAIVAKSNSPMFVRPKYRLYKFRHRMLSQIPGSSSQLSASEVSDIYHFPYGVTTKTENINKSLSRTLPTSTAIKRNSDTSGFDVVLARNNHEGSSTNIGLTAAERERHVYVIGGTGNGKTTMLLYGIIQDIKAGKGVAVVDPHGDLAETILRYIPESRINDVVYFRPRDIGYPIGLNLMELPEGLDEDEMLLEQDFVTEAIISVFRKTFSNDDTGGHRIEYLLRNTIHTAFTVKDATLFTLYDLLTDKFYRYEVVSQLKDKRLKNFWDQEFGKAGDFQRVKMSSGVTNKLGRFERSASVKRVMEQPKSTIDFDDILNSGKVLICNFAKGEIGEDTSELFGISVLAKLQLAALRRARIKQDERLPFYLYVDEFQNFATMSFVQLLSEARKYKLYITMAEQSTAQQEEQRLVNIILANVGTVVCFRSGSPVDERYVLPLFSPYIDEGEISNLPSFNFYMRITAMQAQEPMSGETLLLTDDGSEELAHKVINASRKNYASEYKPKTQHKTVAVTKKAEPKKPLILINGRQTATSGNSLFVTRKVH